VRDEIHDDRPSAFIAAFRRQFGTTPGALRNA
jgi:AraC-like DNA-binding protein